jgi:Transposase DDE domain group 1
LGRLAGNGEKVRRYGDFRYAAKSWNVERRVIARVEAGLQGADSRFIVTNLPGLPKSLYEKLYCARGQAENLIKTAPRLRPHLVPQSDGEPVPTAAYWLMLSLRSLVPKTLVLARGSVRWT